MERAQKWKSWLQVNTWSFRQTPEMYYTWNELQISFSEGIRVNSLMVSIKRKKKRKRSCAGIFFFREFQERWLLGRGSRIPFCMQISVLNWRSYGLMMPGQKHHYLASPCAVIIRWPWDLPNQDSTVSINITFSRIMFSAVPETTLEKNSVRHTLQSFLPLPSPPVLVLPYSGL